MIEPKIHKAMSQQVQPLFDIWKEDAGWTDEEADVMWYKLFDTEQRCDIEIQDILARKYGTSFLYYHQRKINRIYQSARKKLNKILP